MHTNKPKVIDRKILADNYDLNLVTTSGWYEVKSPLNGVKDVINHKVFVMAPNQSKSVTQFVFDEDTKTDMMWFRTSSSSTWSEWKEVATADKFVSKSGDTITGDLKVTGKIDGSLAGKPEAPAPTKDGGDNQIANVGYVNTQISGLVDSAPDALNTLKELAAALGNDQNFSTTITNALAEKLPKAGGTISGDLTVQGKVIGTASFAEKDSKGNNIFDTYAKKTEAGMNIGTILPFLATKVPDGWLSCENGAEISRTTYPELWAWVQENAPLVSETEWQTLAVKQTSVGYYSSGDGSTTFRLPRIVDFIQGSTPTDSGKFTEAGLPNITGRLSLRPNIISNTAENKKGNNSALYIDCNAETKYSGYVSNNAVNYYDKMYIDASESNAIYGKSTTVQPASVKMVYCVRAFGALTNQGTIDVTSLANDVTHRGIEVGTILPFLAKKAPVGWLALDTGAELSRSTYSALWDWVQVNAPVISEEDWQKQAKVQTSVGSYSTGDGSTTFRLPKIVDFVQGTSAADAGTYMSAGLPDITGSFYDGSFVSTASGAFSGFGDAGWVYSGASTRGYNTSAKFDASKSNAIYGNSGTVQPVAVKMLYCVKAFGTAINKNDIDISTLVNDKVSLAALPGLTTGRIVAQSLDTNGWVKFDSGLILQWGYKDNNSSATVTYPISFTKIFSIVAVPNQDVAALSGGDFKIVSISASSVTFNWNAYRYWIAIGK